MLKLLERLLGRLRVGEISDEEVIRDIRRVPRHYSGHRLMLDTSIMPWDMPDPAPGNTTAGSGLLVGFSYNGEFSLTETNASTAEIRTLPDPLKSYHTLALILVANGGQNLVVRCNTPLWIGTTVTQPAITQLGQYITFTAINQVCVLRSVPCTKTSYSGSQATVTNATGVRWVVEVLDGATVT